MNFMKKIFFLATLILIILCSTSKNITAQNTPTPEAKQKREQKRGDREELQAAYNAMLDSLGLTEQQREDIDFINTKYRAQMQQIRQTNEGDFAAMRPKMMELREKQNTELKEVLSEEQFTQYQKWQEENRSKRKGKRPPGNRN